MTSEQNDPHVVDDLVTSGKSTLDITDQSVH